MNTISVSSLLQLLFWCFFGTVIPPVFSSIGCFRCVSMNGSNPDCRDPFNSTKIQYVERCFAQRRLSNGFYPGHFCLKINGVPLSEQKGNATGEIYVRDCITENMGSMCGQFKLEDTFWAGCIQTCRLDGCNSAPVLGPISSVLMLWIVALRS